MGSHVHLVLWGTDDDSAWVEHEVARLEHLWSRFLPTSDVSRCNRAAGQGDIAVKPETVELVAEACRWWQRTAGWFDPTVLHALLEHGYDAPFADVRARPRTTLVVDSAPPGRAALRIPAIGRLAPASATPGCAGIEWDHGANTVRLPEGVGIDLGGIGKGAAADRVAHGLRARGVPSACISMGGDVRAYGHGSDGDGWPIPVEDPYDDTSVMLTHVLHDGAIVTSTDRFRRWHHAGRERHHLIDPTTSHPAEHGLAAVIVADTACARAEVLAKAAFVAGPERGSALLQRFGIEVHERAWFVEHQHHGAATP
jgi:thiamine biosynthesis lipoprotein